MFTYFMCALIVAYVLGGFFYGSRFIMLPQAARLTIMAIPVVLTLVWAYVTYH